VAPLDDSELDAGGKQSSGYSRESVLRFRELVFAHELLLDLRSISKRAKAA